MAKTPEKRCFTDELRTLAWGTDGSFYRMIPKKVILAGNEAQVLDTIKEARADKKGITFRAAGTSLSGQSVTDSILLVATEGWTRWHLSEDHSQVTLQPGIIGARVGRLLAPYGLRFGPDPASIGSCMVGGIVSNNASGMSCGCHESSDALTTGVRIILSDGTILDTSSPESREDFRLSHPAFLKRIEELRDEVLSNASLASRIRYKYEIKNVTGLNLLPFVKYEDPFDIITHLVIGSEGTLAFLSAVTMRTLPLERHSQSAMVYFKDIRDAARAVVALRSQRINAAELLDSRSLASVHDSMWENAQENEKKGITALLLQTRSDDKEAMLKDIEEICRTLEKFPVAAPFAFTDDPAICAKYWSIRSGIFPTVGGMRKEGTTCLIEDIAFHIEDLPQATADLSALLDEFGYNDSCIYGHALEGNFHFIINQSFDSPEEIARYDNMLHAVAKMVVEKYDGSLKAEHGTGRNMAPFVKYEWGEEAWKIMVEVKKLFDPDNIFNPGVIFNDDPECHIKNFKALPTLTPDSDAPEKAIEALHKIDKCIECGFCEVNCLSCGFTLSSRTRIVARREMERLSRILKNPGSLGAKELKQASKRLETLKKQYVSLGEQTCAADGLCSMSCPMGISVADLTKELRRTSISCAEKKTWLYAASHYSSIKNMLRAALKVARLGHVVLGTALMQAVCKALHKLGMPLWTPAFPRAYRAPLNDKTASDNRQEDLKVVYFPSCINQMMGTSAGSPYKRPLVEETIELLHKAGYSVIFPENKDNLCCGELWLSKGMPEQAEGKVRELEKALWEASCHGRYPVLCDQSPCLHRMRECISTMKLYEPAEFIMKFLKDRLVFEPTDESVIIHKTCTMRLMGLDGTLLELAELCSSNVTDPVEVGCCGFAGDKGMTVPELNKWALRKLRPQVQQCGAATGYSNSRTCEIGLETNTGIPYVSIVYLVNSHTSAKKTTK